MKCVSSTVKMSTRQVSEIQKLSGRMDDMAAKFTIELDSFRKEFQNNSSKSGSEASGNFEIFAERFSAFENSIKEMLQGFREEINELKAQEEKSIMAANGSSLLIHGLSENQQDDLYEKVIDVITTKIDPDFNKTDINYCYRLGQKKSESSKPRPIVVNFCRRWMRDRIFYGKKRLKGTKIMFTELLTAVNLKLFKDARDVFKNSCWSKSGRVFVFHNSVKVQVRSSAMLAEIIENTSA